MISFPCALAHHVHIQRELHCHELRDGIEHHGPPGVKWSWRDLRGSASASATHDAHRDAQAPKDRGLTHYLAHPSSRDNMSLAPSNGMRLSCGADFQCSQIDGLHRRTGAGSFKRVLGSNAHFLVRRRSAPRRSSASSREISPFLARSISFPSRTLASGVSGIFVHTQVS